VLGLDAKNSAVILPDADLSTAVSECVLGSLSFNGQRCTALKILFVHESVVDQFVPKFCEAVDKLKVSALPWETGAQITPVAEAEKPKYVKDVVDDALSKGAQIANKGGGRFDKSLLSPTVLYPVGKTMRVYNEEQFGPVVPIVKFTDIQEYYTYLEDSQFGQQASVFSAGKQQQNKQLLADVIDELCSQVSRVNLNCQCQRGPDSFPFVGRKNSAFNTLSILDALRSMSIRCVVATKENESNLDLVGEMLTSRKSKFFRTTYLN
jgi:glyceraldehyde-3-phosphate dehydrogenase (NADP+)